MNQTQSEVTVVLNWKTMILRLVLVAVALVVWFKTQELLGSRQMSVTLQESVTAGKVITSGDAILTSTESINQYLYDHRQAAKILLIISSLFIDLLGIYLLTWSIFGPSIRPFIGMLFLFILRQLCQMLCALPQPTQMLWFDTGFPSLLVTYSVANDFFFSGHTGLAIYGALELIRLKKPWLTTVAILIAIFEVVTVLVLRAHYTMDVYAAIITAILAVGVAGKISPSCDHWIGKLTNP